jgi:hypothetical protein
MAIVSTSLLKFSELRREARGSSQYRQHALAVLAYAVDHRDLPPAAVDPVPLRFSIETIDGSRQSFFASSWSWSRFIYPDSTWAIEPALRSPWWVEPAPEERNGRLTEPSIQTKNTASYRLSCSFYAGPRYWNVVSREGPIQWRVMRLSDVQFPSQKVMIVDHFLWESVKSSFGSSVILAMTDGSVQKRQLIELRDGYPFGDGDVAGSVLAHFWAGPPGQHTIDGTEGRDW